MAWFRELIDHCVANYGVNPAVFAGLYLAKTVIYYPTLYLVIKAIRTRHYGRLPSLIAICLVANATPWVYVYLFGYNLPFWFHVLFVMVLGSGMLLMGRQIKRRIRKAEAVAA